MLIAPRLESSEEVVYEPTDLTLDEARREHTDRFGILWIGGDIMTNPGNVKLYTNGSSAMLVEESVSGQIADIIEKEKLKDYNIENLSQILYEVKTTVYMQVFRNDQMQDDGSDKQANSSAVSTVVGLVLGMILYMFLMIYGAMVMQSVIEEKNNRVLEVVVSSISPFRLMLGKILGIASVAVVQVLIWGVLVCGVGALVMPHLMLCRDDGKCRGDACRDARSDGGGRRYRRWCRRSPRRPISDMSSRFSPTCCST